MLQETLNIAQSLNSDDKPFKYSIDGNKIIGEWKYLDAKWIGIFGNTDVDKQYKLTVTLDESNKSYKVDENFSTKEKSLGFNPLTGKISFGTSQSGFKGKMINRSLGFGIGVANQPQNETSFGAPTVKYDFSNSTIKDPVLELLKKQGWKKTGLFSNLFK